MFTDVHAAERLQGLRLRVPTQWLAAAARAVAARIAAGARASFRGFLAALHEARRRQAAIEQARYRHLIYDHESGLFIGQPGYRQKPPPSE